MDKCVILFLLFLVISEFKCQVNIFGINGPAVIENVSSYNDKGVAVVNIINGPAVNRNSTGAPEDPNVPVVANDVSANVTNNSSGVNQQILPVTTAEVIVPTSVTERPQADNSLNSGPEQNTETHSTTLAPTNLNIGVQHNKYYSKGASSVVSQHQTANPQSFTPAVIMNKEESSQQKSNEEKKFSQQGIHNSATREPSSYDNSKIHFPEI